MPRGPGRRLAELLLERPALLVSSLLLVGLTAAVTSTVPGLVRLAVDRGVVAGSPREAILYAGLIVGATGLAGLMGFASRQLLSRLGEGIVYSLRVRGFEALLRMDMEEFWRYSTGQLLARLTSDAERLAGFIIFRLRMLVYSLSLVTGSLLLMAGMSRRLALIALAGILASVLVNAVYALRVRPVYDRVRHLTGELARAAQGAIAGAETVKALTMEDAVLEGFQRVNAGLYQESLRAARMTAAYGNSPFLVNAVTMAAILYEGSRLALEGQVSVGVLAGFLAYMLTLAWPLRALGFTIGDMQRALASAARVLELADHPLPRAEEVVECRGGPALLLEDVWFSYEPGRPVLRGVTLRVEPGERVLIVGPPGSGKTTLLRIAAGLLRPDKGRARVYGVDPGSLPPGGRKRCLAYSPQEPFVYDLTARLNIALPRPDASDEEVLRAARAAAADFVERLPQGLETRLGERGARLSGGQKQRVQVARTLLAGSPLILLDDPASMLDAETAERLARGVDSHAGDAAVIMTGARSELLRAATRVVVLVDGRVAWDGPPGELPGWARRYIEYGGVGEG